MSCFLSEHARGHGGWDLLSEEIIIEKIVYVFHDIALYSHFFNSPWYINTEFCDLIELHAHYLKYEEHYNN